MSIIYLGKATPASGQGGGGTGAVEWGNIGGSLENQTDLAEALAAKQDVLTAGTGIDITNGVISATGGGSTPESILDARTETAIRLWTGNATQYNNGGSTTYYNWQSGGWQAKTSGVSGILYSVAYGNGKYVAVGASGNILVSTDEGATWTAETSGVSKNLNAVTYSNGVFVAVGASGTVVISSGDGTWTKKSRLGDNMRAVAYGNSMFMATDNDGHCCVSADDGNTWTTYNEVLPAANATGLVYNPNDGSFYCVCNSQVYTSVNGQSWTQVATVNNGTRIAYGSNKLIVVGDSGVIYGSTDFTNWAAETSGVSGTLTGVTYANGKFYAVGAGETILSSTGNGTWTIEHTGTTLLYSLAYGQNYVVVGASGAVLTSDGNPALSVYTTDQNPTTESTVYSDTTTQSALTITAVGTGTITLSDTNTYDYNSAGNQTVTQTVGQAHPDWLCFIEGVGIKMGNVSFIPAVDQTYNASSTNAQSGVAVASGISDTLGTINTSLESIIQGD